MLVYDNKLENVFFQEYFSIPIFQFFEKCQIFYKHVLEGFLNL